ncbi:MAG: hypothetical protein CME70_14945 [Halobacteriovorax sp.]|nr:hypothetical protein [Halobacteriovorax sp.]|tara:strand:- start:142510 stop:143100 length:591 start_codon:yes stop_codon:yes gene_type:complete
MAYALIPNHRDQIDCIQDIPKNPYVVMVASTEDLRSVVTAFKTKQELMKADITYGGLGLGVGTADIYFNTKDGKIVDLNIVADVGILGFKERIHPMITLDQILAGEPLVFRMNGSNRGVLIVQPLEDMTAQGGSALLNIWNGKSYTQELISIKKINGEFKAYSIKDKKAKKIKRIKINMGGMSIPSMYVRGYKIKY